MSNSHLTFDHQTSILQWQRSKLRKTSPYKNLFYSTPNTWNQNFWKVEKSLYDKRQGLSHNFCKLFKDYFQECIFLFKIF